MINVHDILVHFNQHVSATFATIHAAILKDQGFTAHTSGGRLTNMPDYNSGDNGVRLRRTVQTKTFVQATPPLADPIPPP